MKSKDKIKQKKHESTIGKIIYGFLLFMPLLAIGITCAYAIFNKNAYQSYANYEEPTTINVSLNTTLNNGETYKINYTGEQITNGYEYNVLNYQTNIRELYFPNENFNITKFSMISENQRTRILVYDENNTIHNLFDFQNTSNSFYFVSNGINTKGTMNTYYTITTLQYTTGKLSNVFYYSIDKVEDSNLFNWAKDSIIYTGMSNTCNALNITTTFIPLLLTYWLIISVIYFLYDIILIILHVFHRKIHELEESI